MNSKPEKRVPMRRCVGCSESKPKHELMRFVIRDGIIVPDPKAVLPGRGFYLDRNNECFQKALKRKAFQRILKRDLTDAERTLLEETLQEE